MDAKRQKPQGGWYAVRMRPYESHGPFELREMAEWFAKNLGKTRGGEFFVGWAEVGTQEGNDE
jgi:hypothetical protein